jgi:uncharacterized FlaG/YvyC family protein
MATLTAKYFDVFNFVKKAREFGVNEQFAEYEARQIEQAINAIANDVKAEIKQKIHSDELATKKDLELVKLELQKEIKEIELRLSSEIHKSKMDTIVWLSGIMVTLVLASGLIQHFFK